MSPEPTLECGSCTLRPFRPDDLDELVAIANNEKVSAMLRDRFPYPYTRADGERYLEDTLKAERDDWRLAIEVEGRFAGSVGFHRGEDVHRHSAEVGYWIGEPYWGRGILADAPLPGVPAEAVDAAMDTLGGAVAVSSDLPPEIGAELLRAARGAFMVGIRICAAISTLGALGLAVFVYTTLRNAGRSTPA